MNKNYLKRSFDLLVVLLSAEFKTKYSSTTLGYFWSILNPLVFATVYFFAFKVVLKVKIDNYAMFLIAGLFPWQAIQNSMNTNSNIFLFNGNLIKNIIFPRSLLPSVVVLNDLLHFILSFPILLGGMYYYGFHLSFTMLWGIPLLLLTQLFLTLGISLFIASLNIVVRDMERLVEIFTMLWFFVTPIIYADSMVPCRFRWILFLNPATGIIINWRNLFMGHPIELYLLFASIGMCIPITLLGFGIYRKLNWRFAEFV